MGEVYEASAPDISRTVAVKRMMEQNATDENLLPLFLREMLVASTLEHHNIVEVIDVGKAKNELFLVMELVAGPTLAEILEAYKSRSARLPLNVACGLAMQIAQGLAHAHERCQPDGTPLGIVHRDVAPENVLIGHDGVPKLVDFGLAKLNGQDLTQPGIIRGRPRSLAPEQARGDPTDARADIFALGATLFEMVSGECLYPQETIATLLYRVASGDYEPIGLRIPNADPGLIAIIEKALSPNVSARHRSARQFERALGSFRATRELRLTTQAIAEVVHQTWPTIVERRHEVMQHNEGELYGQTIVLPADELKLLARAPSLQGTLQKRRRATTSNGRPHSLNAPLTRAARSRPRFEEAQFPQRSPSSIPSRALFGCRWNPADRLYTTVITLTATLFLGLLWFISRTY